MVVFYGGRREVFVPIFERFSANKLATLFLLIYTNGMSFVSLKKKRTSLLE
jgi:hypothetical protein